MQLVGISHLDIKPGNIMINADYQLVLTDFNISTMDSGCKSKVKYVTTTAGTPAYQAPECREKSPQFLGRKADLFAVGLMLFIMMVGKRPYHSPGRYDDLY